MIRAPPRSVLRSAATIELIEGMVVVSSADRPTRFGRWVSTAATNCSAVTLVPRSITSMFAPRHIIATRFLPMSCRSPRTVPMIARASGWMPALTRIGSRSAIDSRIARAATSISGTKIRLAWKSSPTASMASVIASRIACGVIPSAMAAAVRRDGTVPVAGLDGIAEGGQVNGAHGPRLERRSLASGCGLQGDGGGRDADHGREYDRARQLDVGTNDPSLTPRPPASATFGPVGCPRAHGRIARNPGASPPVETDPS